VLPLGWLVDAFSPARTHGDDRTRRGSRSQRRSTLQAIALSFSELEVAPEKVRESYLQLIAGAT